jgi:hypothetical protein
LDLECVLVDRVLWCLVWVMVRLSDRGTGNGEREREREGDGEEFDRTSDLSG